MRDDNYMAGKSGGYKYEYGKFRDDEIDLLDLAKKLIRYWWAFVLAVVIGGGVAGAYSAFMITPQYQAECMFYVNNGSISVGSTSVSLQDLDASQSLVDTYMVILQSRKVLMEVADVADVPYTYEEMKSIVTSAKVKETEVFSVYVKSADPVEAEKIANTIAKVLPDAISDIVEGSSVKIVDYAVVPSTKISPSNLKNSMIGALGLLVLVGLLITLRILLDNTIQSDEDLFELTRYPLISKIPEQSGNNMTFATQEAYRLLKTNLIYSLPSEERGKIVGVTSSVASDYKTTTAINLATSLAADSNKKVLLLDCDLRMSEVAERLELSNTCGLTDFLTGDVNLASIVQQKNEYPNLFIIVGGNSSPNPGDLLRSNKMKKTFEDLATAFDYIIVAFPPANIVSDALELGKSCDGMVVVVRQNFTQKQAFVESLSKLEFVDINVIGVVFTGVDNVKSYRSGREYKKYYGNYRNASEDKKVN